MQQGKRNSNLLASNKQPAQLNYSNNTELGQNSIQQIYLQKMISEEVSLSSSTSSNLQDKMTDNNQINQLMEVDSDIYYSESSSWSGKGSSLSQKTEKCNVQKEKKKKISKLNKISSISTLKSQRKTKYQKGGRKSEQKSQSQEYGICDISFIDRQKQVQSTHFIGGVINHNNTILQKEINNNQLKFKQNSQSGTVQCTLFENHIFNSNLIIKLKHFKAPSLESPFLISKEEQIQQINKQSEQKLERKIIDSILSDGLQRKDITLPLVMSQRESIQNEQITNYVNKNFDEQSFYSFHVFSSDFQHREINLNQIGLSYKLLTLLNFNYQSCSLFQCQQLFNDLYTLEQYQQLQQTIFYNDDETHNQIKEIQINTFDKFSLNCKISVQKLSFKYPPHISQLFQNINERVYFIKYHIDHSHISSIYNMRSQNFNKLQNHSQSKDNNNQKSYYEISEEFIQKYYSEELKIQKELELINHIDEQDKFSLTLLRNQFTNNNTHQQCYQQKISGKQQEDFEINQQMTIPLEQILNQPITQNNEFNELKTQNLNLNSSVSTKDSEIQDEANNFEEEDEDDDIDILLLKIQLIKTYQQQMQQLQQQQQIQALINQNNNIQQLQLRNYQSSSIIPEHSYKTQNNHYQQKQSHLNCLMNTQSNYNNNNNNNKYDLEGNTSEDNYELYLDQNVFDDESLFSHVKRYPSFVDF